MDLRENVPRSVRMFALATTFTPADKEAYGAHMFTPRSKTWTFPSLKTPAGPADVYLAVEEEPAPYGSPFRGVG